jgi:acylphosphatase
MSERAWRVEGRVQGVGFRWNTVQRARRLGLQGRVWNRDDGAVEVHASGPEAALDTLEAFLQRGPSAARVDEVRRVAAGEWARAAEFRVRR